MGNCFNTSYVDITSIETSGAGETAERNNLTPGINSSHSMARTDLKRINKYSAIIRNVAREKNIDPAVIAAILSRESHGEIEENVNPVEHLSKITEKLSDHIEAIEFKFPRWTKEQQLKGAIAAFNAGAKNIHSHDYVDEYTSGKDYASDVIARAQWFKNNMF